MYHHLEGDKRAVLEVAIALLRQDEQKERNDKRNRTSMEAALVASQTDKRKGKHQASFVQTKSPKHFKKRRNNVAPQPAVHLVSVTNAPSAAT